MTYFANGGLVLVATISVAAGSPVTSAAGTASVTTGMVSAGVLNQPRCS